MFEIGTPTHIPMQHIRIWHITILVCIYYIYSAIQNIENALRETEF